MLCGIWQGLPLLDGGDLNKASPLADVSESSLAVLARRNSPCRINHAGDRLTGLQMLHLVLTSIKYPYKSPCTYQNRVLFTVTIAPR